jgi:hypothetical protein
MKTNGVDISEESQLELATGVLKEAAQRELAAGVLKQAAQDLRRFHGATSKIERELYLDAYRWLTVDECSSPFSFLNVCQLLNLAPENFRQELVGDSSLGRTLATGRDAAARCGPTSDFVCHFFVNERNGHAQPGDMVFNNAPSAAGACLHENVN